jgi:hypothetical protein
MSAATDSLTNNRARVFNYLMTMGRTGSVKITISPVVNGTIHDDMIMVQDAPPRVVTELITKFKMISLHDGGLLIPVTEH